LEAEVLDLDGDGHDEIWVHSAHFSAIVSPWRGGVVEEFTSFLTETNYANTLTRRREAYHDTALEQRVESSGGDGGTPSIHDLEEGLRLDQRPPVDAEARAWFLDRVLPGTLTLEQYAADDYRPIQSWSTTQLEYSIETQPGSVEIVCRSGTLEKRVRFSAEGQLSVSYRWDPSLGAESDWFAVELSLSAPLDIQTDPPAEVWSFVIETVAKSERGLDRTRQGESVTFRWPVRMGEATIGVKAPAYGGSASPSAQVLQMP
ncbi:MAG TPA: alpha-amylase/4-alpha-glucanotransferase domain-containing protein, partial [Gemmatimonadales bacterium]